MSIDEAMKVVQRAFGLEAAITRIVAGSKGRIVGVWWRVLWRGQVLGAGLSLEAAVGDALRGQSLN